MYRLLIFASFLTLRNESKIIWFSNGDPRIAAWLICVGIFSVLGGGGSQRCQLQYLWRDIAKMYIHAYMRTHIIVHMKTHVHAPKCSYSHACMHTHMHACMHIHQNIYIYIHSYMKIKASALYDIEFRESDVTPGRTEVKQGKFVKYIFPAKDLEKLINYKT